MPDLPALTTEQIRRVIELHAGGVAELAEALGKSQATVELYTRGATPQGHGPAPSEAKIIGKSRIFCIPEWVEWAKRAE